MFENVREDVRMYAEQLRPHSLPKRLLYLAATQEFHAVLTYRFGYWVAWRCHLPVVRQLLLALYFLLRKWSEMIIGINIWPNSRIGPGLKIEHGGCIIIVGTLGKRCRVSQGVTIGHIGGFHGGGCPTLGDEVSVGAGAKVLGDITVGDRVMIGANAVVISDIPAGSTAVGVPARIIEKAGRCP